VVGEKKHDFEPISLPLRPQRLKSIASFLTREPIANTLDLPNLASLRTALAREPLLSLRPLAQTVVR